jgi:hypothetical protein
MNKKRIDKKIKKFENNPFVNKINLYQNTPLLQDVLKGYTTLRYETENFYNLESSIIDENEIDNKENPDELIYLLNNFTKKPFNKDKLNYNYVREEYKTRYKKDFRRSLGITLGICASYLLYDTYITGDIKTLSVAGLFSAGSIISYASILPYLKNNKNKSLKEYQRLHKCAKKTDLFIEKYYLKYSNLKNKRLIN